jgi:hypothetical protein
MVPFSQHMRERVSSMKSVVSKRDDTPQEREREKKEETVLCPGGIMPEISELFLGTFPLPVHLYIVINAH